MKRCYFCGRELEVSRVVGREEICPQCHRDVRCCFNCTFYDPQASNQCREPQSETISDRGRSTFCDFFLFGDKEDGNQGKQAAERAREEWERLFRK